MSNFIRIIVPVLLLVVLVVWLRKKNNEVSAVVSRVDGKEYIVQNRPDKQYAADLLAVIRKNLLKLVRYLGDLKEHHPNYEILLQRFNPNVFTESSATSSYTTYTLNKGEKIVFCLRARDSKEHLHDLNLLIFVAIHELGHIMTKSQGHTQEFKENFLYLLEKAVELGIYKPEDFRAKPRTYCGINVTDTPLNDDFIASNQ